MSILRYFKTPEDNDFDSEALGPKVPERETGMGYLKTFEAVAEDEFDAY